MSIARQSCPFSTIILNIASRLSTGMSINSQYVRIVASDTYKPTEQPAKSLYLRVLGIKPRGTGFPEQGAGRLAVNIARKVRIDIWVRNQQDNVANDTAALTAPNIGLFFLEEQVLNLLIDYDPKINNKLILLEPVHLTEG